jgi:hypothetical protein
MGLLAGAVFLAAACGSTKLRVSPKDGAADSASGGALGTGGTGTGTLGSGGTAVTTIPGGGGGVGSGGSTPGITGSGGRGSGGVGSGGSSSGGGNPGTGGSPGSGGSTGVGGASLDAAAVDVARDQAAILDTAAAVDAGDAPPPMDGGPDMPVPPSDVRMDLAPPDSSPSSCAQATTQTECEARTDCHAVFFDLGGCACAALGCCVRFDHCGDGATAACTGTAFCKMMAPHCEGPYLIAYKDSCYEGCVLGTDCAP